MLFITFRLKKTTFCASNFWLSKKTDFFLPSSYIVLYVKLVLIDHENMKLRKGPRLMPHCLDFFKRKLPNNKNFFFAVHRTSHVVSCGIFCLKNCIDLNNLKVLKRWEVCFPAGLKYPCGSFYIEINSNIEQNASSYLPLPK